MFGRDSRERNSDGDETLETTTETGRKITVYRGRSRNLRYGGRPLPLEVGSPFNQGVWKSAVSSPSGVREPRPKTNLVHSKAARKPLVAIILRRRHNTVPLSLIRSTVTASVRRQGGGGRSRLGPLLNPPLV